MLGCLKGVCAIYFIRVVVANKSNLDFNQSAYGYREPCEKKK